MRAAALFGVLLVACGSSPARPRGLPAGRLPVRPPPPGELVTACFGHEDAWAAAAFRSSSSGAVRALDRANTLADRGAHYVCFDTMEAEVGPALARHCPSFDTEDDPAACGVLHHIALDVARMHMPRHVGRDEDPPRVPGRVLLELASSHCVLGHGPQARNAELGCARLLRTAERAFVHTGDPDGARRARAILDDPANGLRDPAERP